MTPAARNVALTIVGVDELQLTAPLEARRGEVLGLTGLRGAGHEEMLYGVVGARPGTRVNLGDGERSLTPARAAASGIALVAADRLGAAMWAGGTILENLAITGQRSRAGLLRKNAERAWARAAASNMAVAPLDLSLAVARFSGGNQQRISLARWMDNPRVRVLLVHEPIQGIDLKARRQIISALRRQAVANDIAVVIASSDYAALAEIADRVAVLHDHSLTSVLSGEITEQRIESAATFGGTVGTASLAKEC